MIRAASSLISGGAVLRHVGTTRSESFILVDNVVSGAEWVASAMTYDFRPTEAFVSELWDRIGVVDAGLRSRLLEGFETRALLMDRPPRTQHENAVLAEPAMMLEFAVQEAGRRGYQVIDMGADISGDVNDVVAHWSSAIEASPPGCVALVGVGEVTVKVRGSGEGGRCQEFAWLMADVLAKNNRVGAFVAQASDGRDHIQGVGGAWVDGETRAAAGDRGIDWAGVGESHDTYSALKALGRLIKGGHTGWNLCDLYVAVLA
jgi:hydroxypyruvate reductase/glycerate 2-kinase